MNLTTASDLRIYAALRAHGISLKPWPRLTTHQVFQWQNFDGLLHFVDGNMVIVSIMADRPGSGKLGDLMTRVETAADECDMPIFVVHFWNLRLRQWFGRRGYLLSENTVMGRFAARATTQVSAS